MDTSAKADLQLLTTAEAAAVLRVSPATLRSWVLSGRVESVRHGREYRFEMTALTCVKEPAKCHSISVKAHRFGGRTSALLDTRDFEYQLTQLIEKKRKPSMTSSERSSGRGRARQGTHPA